MQTIKECEADAARALFLTYGVSVEMLGFAAVSGLDLSDEVRRRELPGAVVRASAPLRPSLAPMWDAGSCGGGHINAPIMNSNGPRWSQCAKCRKVFGLSLQFVEGSHLVCGGCGQNLLLKNMTNAEFVELVKRPDSSEADAAQKLFVDFGFTAAFLMNSQRLNSNTRGFAAMRPSQMAMWDTGSCGGGKTAAHIGSLVHNKVYELLRADKAHQLKEQALVARAAYKLGQLSASEDRKERKSAIKRNLVQGLVDAGVRLGDVQTIMNNMLKELNNE